MKRRLNLLREFSVPLLAGVVVALAWANVDSASYHAFIDRPLLGALNFHFITNDIFMVLFFGIAAAEITRSSLPGGDLNPPSKVINPILATVGGVLGPVVVYLFLATTANAPELIRGWGIPTATDIALAWLVARLVFGANHPAIPFILLLAIADDAIGLVIIAVFYPDPSLPVVPEWLLLTGTGMAIAWLLRRIKLESYWPCLILGGIPSWLGLFKAHIHPALALVFVVPFLPSPRHEKRHLFEEDASASPLSRFEHEWKVVVDFGLFMFGLANAGVEFTSMGLPTWLVLIALVGGKTIGITSLGWLGIRFGLFLPDGMGLKDLLVTGMIAGIGFTVALFMASEAFTDPFVQGAAKMGAMLSVVAAPLAWGLARLLGVRHSRYR